MSGFLDIYDVKALYPPPSYHIDNQQTLAEFAVKCGVLMVREPSRVIQAEICHNHMAMNHTLQLQLSLTMMDWETMQACSHPDFSLVAETMRMMKPGQEMIVDRLANGSYRYIVSDA